MNDRLGKGAAASTAFHLLVLAALLFLIRPPPIEPMPDLATFEVDVEGPQQEARHADVSAPVPASTTAPTPSPAPPTPQPPKPLPPSDAVPPPPPPPSAAPPPIPVPPIPTPPPPILLPPPTPEAAPTLAPPPRPAPPTPAPPLPVPPPPLPPPPVPRPVTPTPTPPSQSSQPHETKNAAPDSRAAENNLDKLMSIMRQRNAPTARYNPQASGAPVLGGSVHGTDNSSLNAQQRGAIGDKVRECWGTDTGAKDYATFSVHLIVTTDAQGVAHEAVIAPGDPAAPLGSPLHAFGERATHAVLSPRCAALPLPGAMLGQVHRFDFIFKP